MLRLTAYPMMLFAMFLTTGCGQKERIEVEERALFCDVEEARKFTQEEIDWRSKNAPWNLRRDYKTNLTWDRECAEEQQDAASLD